MLNVKEYYDFCAELAGTNSCVDNKRKAKLFMKFRKMASDLQYKNFGKRRIGENNE